MVTRWLNIKTYFCDPNCAWQKGSNEYHNGVLRRYIPKKADLTPLSQIDLDAIVEEINNRPKKCLGYQTAGEAFRKELKYNKCSDCRCQLAIATPSSFFNKLVKTSLGV